MPVYPESPLRNVDANRLAPHGLFAGVFLAFAGFVSLSSAAAASDLKAVTLSAAGDLRPGQEITVTWEPLPPDTEEFELLLRLEAPVALTLRLTECEDPSVEHLSWRVPAVPCDRATLLLRHGRKRREALWGMSLPFSIRRVPRGTLQRVTLRLGELWVCDAPAPHAIERTAAGITPFPSGGADPLEGGQPSGWTVPPNSRRFVQLSRPPGPRWGARYGDSHGSPFRTPLRI